MVSDKDLMSLESYKNERNFISSARDNKKTWDEIDYACKGSEDALASFLYNKREDEWWKLFPDEWHRLVKIMKDVDEKTQSGFIGDPKKGTVSVPKSPNSCWQCYKTKLLSTPNFSLASVNNIEKSAQKIISYLEIDTEPSDPVRGMVVGNVQSGKTANMAGVIAMAADYGFNFFIVLTGTIDNLRIQTRERLISDLSNPKCGLDFHVLDNLSATSTNPERLVDLFLVDSNKRYISVCLKNSTRLKNLLNWLNSDLKIKSTLRILLIDDEADQAGINTKSISKAEQTAISRLIKNIVFSRNASDKDSMQYGCMNYIGYTATPYANFLNESGPATLYPKNFISLLSTPSEYYGPAQIFGIDGTNPPLPIVNSIDKEEVKIFKNDEIKGTNELFPSAFRESIDWFILTVAVSRYWNLQAPVSMLIHTSQVVNKHSIVANALEQFINSIRKNSGYIAELKKVYQKQTQSLPLLEFKSLMKDYLNLDLIKDYPSFNSILPFIKELLNIGVTHIQFDDNSVLTYNKGLHLCIDNCKSNSTGEYQMRIVYPEKNDVIMKETPAFIIIGGSTLSRGLTLKGLTTSYFLRSTNQADTLMQMGRWFGYRHNYELLPRIWMSNSTIERFTRLSKLDYDLREEIVTMEIKNLKPSEYAPRIDKFPDYKELVMTAKNKMQSSIDAEVTFYNKSAQTTWFYRDDEILKSNFDSTVNFLNSLGKVDKSKYPSLKNNFLDEHKNPLMWFDVDYKKVLDYISTLEIPAQRATFPDIPALKEWYEKQFDEGNIGNFTVIAGGLNTKVNNDVILENGTVIHLESRNSFEFEGPGHKDYSKFIDLNTITQSNERLMDINCSQLSDFDREELAGNKIRFREKRVKYASDKNPLLIVYIVDKDGGGDSTTDTTVDSLGVLYKRKPLKTLGLSSHIVGYYIYIPYGNNNEVVHITIPLNYDEEEAE